MADLFLYDSDDGSFDPANEAIIATGMTGITTKPKGVDSWDALAKAILAESAIGHLVLHFHGNDGQLQAGGDMRFLDEKSVTGLFTAATRVPKVNKITFLGCNVGNLPHRMATFAKLFGAKQVSGYTWYTVNQAVTIKFPKGTDEAAARKAMAPFTDYSAAPLPDPMAVEKVHTKKGAYELRILVFYGSQAGSFASAIPIPFGESKTRKPRKDAALTTLTEKQAAGLAGTVNPVPGFEFVTVTF
jgi:hypothetical protein